MAKPEKLQLSLEQAVGVGRDLLLNPDVGYFSRSSLERALREQKCEPKLAQSLSKDIIRDANQQYAEEHNPNIDIKPRRNYSEGIKLERTTFVPEGRKDEVTLYYNAGVVKEHIAQQRYEAALKAQEAKIAAEKAAQDAELARQKEAEKKPSPVTVVLTAYRKGTNASEISEYISSVEENADKRHTRLIPNVTDGYPDPLATVIERKSAVDILNNGISEQELQVLIATTRAKILSTIQQMRADAAEMAQAILDKTTELSTTRRGTSFYSATLVQRGYLSMLHRELARLAKGNDQIQGIETWDEFDVRPLALQLAHTWDTRYDEDSYRYYETDLQERALTGEMNADVLYPLLSDPANREALRNGKSIQAADGSELTPEAVDELLLGFIMNDNLITQIIMADVIRFGFLTSEFDEGVFGEETAIALRLLMGRINRTEIVEAFQNVPLDTSALQQQIDDIKKRVSALQREAKGNSKHPKAKEAQKVQGTLPPLVHLLRATQQVNLHPVYARIQLLVGRHTPEKSPNPADYPVDEGTNNSTKYNIDYGLYELREVIRPNYLTE